MHVNAHLDVDLVAVQQTDVLTLMLELDAWCAARAATLERAGEGLHVITASSVRPIDRVFPLAAVSDAGEVAISLELAPPVDIGTAVHRVMELITLPAGDDIEAITAAVCAESGIAPATAEVLELSRRCLAAPSVQRALGSDRYEREVPFSAVLDNGTHLVGRMDLVFREGDELVIVDFKTDKVEAAEELDAATVGHSGQAAAYAQATERGTGLAVREVVFVYARAGRSGYRLGVACRPRPAQTSPPQNEMPQRRWRSEPRSARNGPNCFTHSEWTKVSLRTR